MKKSTLYTRTGDQGKTGLGDGRRISKHSARIEAIGGIDELNSFLGMLGTKGLPEDIRQPLVKIQHQLFTLGAELAAPGRYPVTAESITNLEQWIDQLSSELPPLKAFILPGGTPPAATCHFARSICRRAERRVVELAEQEQLDINIQIYLNRLSDLLFAMARWINHQSNNPDTTWNHE